MKEDLNLKKVAQFHRIRITPFSLYTYGYGSYCLQSIDRSENSNLKCKTVHVHFTSQKHMCPNRDLATSVLHVFNLIISLIPYQNISLPNIFKNSLFSSPLWTVSYTVGESLPIFTFNLLMLGKVKNFIIQFNIHIHQQVKSQALTHMGVS